MFWIELRCDTDPRERPLDRFGQCACDTDRGVGPMTGCYDLRTGRKRVEASAKKGGWRNIEGVGWCCPACAASVKESDNG